MIIDEIDKFMTNDGTLTEAEERNDPDTGRRVARKMFYMIRYFQSKYCFKDPGTVHRPVPVTDRTGKFLDYKISELDIAKYDKTQLENMTKLCASISSLFKDIQLGYEEDYQKVFEQVMPENWNVPGIKNERDAYNMVLGWIMQLRNNAQTLRNADDVEFNYVSTSHVQSDRRKAVTSLPVVQASMDGAVTTSHVQADSRKAVASLNVLPASMDGAVTTSHMQSDRRKALTSLPVVPASVTTSHVQSDRRKAVASLNVLPASMNSFLHKPDVLVVYPIQSTASPPLNQPMVFLDKLATRKQQLDRIARSLRSNKQVTQVVQLVDIDAYDPDMIADVVWSIEDTTGRKVKVYRLSTDDWGSVPNPPQHIIDSSINGGAVKKRPRKRSSRSVHRKLLCP